ncbi:hypothetical protein A4X13_0g605 [Tilletia indica]|uniref:Uncharacterized protein n=1 Tax=Tilletia indica TaxID=43049 RepID=A0A8T8TEM6_9BASI|nr:hypothetical protein A4X13_0g605 [Tilletia indica]
MTKARKKLIVKIGRFDFEAIQAKGPKFFHLLHYECEAAPQLSQLIGDATQLLVPSSTSSRRNSNASSTASSTYSTTTTSTAHHHQMYITPPTFDSLAVAASASSSSVAEWRCAYVDQEGDLVWLRNSSEWLAFLLSEAPRFKDAIVPKVYLMRRSEAVALGASFDNSRTTPTSPIMKTSILDSPTNNAQPLTEDHRRGAHEPSPSFRVPVLTRSVSEQTVSRTISGSRHNRSNSTLSDSADSPLALRKTALLPEVPELDRTKHVSAQRGMQSLPPSSSGFSSVLGGKQKLSNDSYKPARPLRKGVSIASIRQHMTQGDPPTIGPLLGPAQLVAMSEKSTFIMPVGGGESVSDGSVTTFGLALTTEEVVEEMDFVPTGGGSRREGSRSKPYPSPLPLQRNRSASAVGSLGLSSSVIAEEEDDSILFWGMADADAEVGGLTIRTWQYQWPPTTENMRESADGSHNHCIRAALVPSRRLAARNIAVLARAAWAPATSADVHPNEIVDKKEALIELPLGCLSAADRAYVTLKWSEVSAFSSKSGMGMSRSRSNSAAPDLALVGGRVPLREVVDMRSGGHVRGASQAVRMMGARGSPSSSLSSSSSSSQGTVVGVGGLDGIKYGRAQSSAAAPTTLLTSSSF